MLIFLILGILTGAMIGHGLGMRKGFDMGIKIAREWEGLMRDWRMRYQVETANTEHERQAIIEARELERMYDGF